MMIGTKEQMGGQGGKKSSFGVGWKENKVIYTMHTPSNFILFSFLI